MKTLNRHHFRLDYVDVYQRRWCAICLLPETNARAIEAHHFPDIDDPTTSRYDRDGLPERASQITD